MTGERQAMSIRVTDLAPYAGAKVGARALKDWNRDTLLSVVRRYSHGAAAYGYAGCRMVVSSFIPPRRPYIILNAERVQSYR